MKKQNQNVVNEVVAEDVNVEEIKGGKTMKKISNNKFVKKEETRKEEKKAEMKANQEKEILDAVEPVDITGVMKAVEDKEANCFRDENGNACNVRGGKYLQKPLNLGGSQWTVAAKTEEELEAKEKAIKEQGLSGDGMYHKILNIGGYQCDCCGATLEELEEDILAAKKYAKKLSEGHLLYDTDTAEQLVDAGLDKEQLEEIKVNNRRYIINYNNLIINNEGKEVKCPCVLTFEGDLLVSLEGLSSLLTKEDVKTILLERLNSYLKDHNDPLDDYESYDDEEDYDEDYDDEDDYDDDYCDDEEDELDYDQGYEDGYNIGYQDGKETGYDEGQENGYNKGHENGYDEGYDEGYDVGHDIGCGEGHAVGYKEGQKDGINLGYNKGIKDCIEAMDD